MNPPIATDIETMTAAELIKKWLDYKGRDYTQKQLAIEAGMSQSGVSMIVRGIRSPDNASIQKIARALGVSMSDFWLGPEEYERRRQGRHERPELVPDEPDMSDIPLLTSIPAGDWKTWIDDYPTGFGEGTVPREGETGKHIIAIRVEGDSMVPDLYPDDILIINPKIPFTRLRGGIGLVFYGDGYKIRRVYQMGDTYRLEPSNRLYDVETVPVVGTKIFKIIRRRSAQDEHVF